MECAALVSQHVGVAIVTEAASVGLSAEGVVIRPLSDPDTRDIHETGAMRVDEALPPPKGEVLAELPRRVLVSV
jgi:hypothetical protein